LVFWAKKNPNIDEHGIARWIRVDINPPSSMPKMLIPAAGKVEKCPPSHRNEKQTNME